MTEDTLLSQLDELGILTLTFNNPAVKNAIDTATQHRLVRELYDAARNPAVRVVVLTGAGNAFCTGSDVRSMGSADPGDAIAGKWGNEPIWNAQEARTDRLRKLMEAPLLLHTMCKPTIAMVRGAAAGAGMCLALACDFRLVSDNALFVTAFAKIGMPGDYGGSYFLTRLVGPAKAKELYMLGERIDARQAMTLGMVNRLVSNDSLEQETQTFARQLAAGPPIVLRYIKENINSALDLSVQQVFDLEAKNMIRCRLTDDSREAMAAFLGKREPVFNGT